MAELSSANDPSPWVPEADPQNLKALGKLAEVLAECGALVARCVVQGIGEAEPVTGKPNRAWLEEEIADVEANIEVVKVKFGLDRERIAARKGRKFDYLMRWLAMLPPAPADRHAAALRRVLAIRPSNWADDDDPDQAAAWREAAAALGEVIG